MWHSHLEGVAVQEREPFAVHARVPMRCSGVHRRHACCETPLLGKKKKREGGGRSATSFLWQPHARSGRKHRVLTGYAPSATYSFSPLAPPSRYQLETSFRAVHVRQFTKKTIYIFLSSYMSSVVPAAGGVRAAHNATPGVRAACDMQHAEEHTGHRSHLCCADIQRVQTKNLLVRGGLDLLRREPHRCVALAAATGRRAVGVTGGHGSGSTGAVASRVTCSGARTPEVSYWPCQLTHGTSCTPVAVVTADCARSGHLTVSGA